MEEVSPTKQLIEEDNPHIFNKLLKMAAYPVAALSGFWVARKEISDGAYDRLKGDRAFNSIAAEIQPKNEFNVASRGSNVIQIEEFLAKASSNKNSYRQATNEIMSHYGLGNTLKEFPAQWEYVSRSVRRNAVINGMTVGGIAIGAMLTIANSKSLIDYFAGDNKENKSR